MSRRINTRTVRVPFRVANGQLEYFYGSRLPTLKEGAIGDLVLPALDITVEDVRRKLLAEQVIPLLPKSTNLLIRINDKSIPRNLALRSQRECLDGAQHTPCVRMVLRDPLSIRWRGAKLATVESFKCEIPALPRKTAESVNHAYRLVSEAFEPHRRSHTANVFQEVFHQVSGRWLPLETLRNGAEARFESLLTLGEQR